MSQATWKPAGWNYDIIITSLRRGGEQYDTKAYLSDYARDEIVCGLEKYPDEDISYVTYASDNEQVVQIDKKGKITLLSEGTAIISASYGGITTKLRITVEKDE